MCPDWPGTCLYQQHKPDRARLDCLLAVDLSGCAYGGSTSGGLSRREVPRSPRLDHGPRATQTAAPLREIAGRYGWTDTAGGRPRFTIQVTILDSRTQQARAHLRDTVQRVTATCHSAS